MSTKSRTRVAGKSLRKAGVGGAALTLAAATAIAGAGVANANATFTFTRIAGPDRYATSVLTAQAFGNSANLILASGEADHTVDALTAAYVAGIQNAPILLTKIDMTPQNVRDQITASGAKNITIVGGTAAVSQAQENALRASGLTVTRLFGIDRYATGAAVIGAGGAATTQTALLATGQDFADALGGGALSDAKRLPLGLTKTDSLPDSTLAAFKAAGVTKVIVLGGVAAVSQNVVDQLAANGITVTARLQGANRAGTSAALADYEITNYGFTNKHVNVASGYALGGGADALGGDALSGQQLTPLLITNNILDPGAGVEAFLKAHAPTLENGIIFGGVGAVSASNEATMTADARTGTVTPPATNQTFTVTPGSPQTVNAGTTATFTVSGLGTAPVDIQLFNCNNVSTNNGTVTFPNSTSPGNANNFAAPGNIGNATISSVNNALGAPTNGVTPTNGTVTFTVTDPTAGTCVVPVVFQQGGPGSTNPNQVALGTNNQPTAPFGVGGATTFITPAGVGNFGPVTVANANGTTFTTTTGLTFTYKASDVFRLVQDNAAAGVGTVVPDTFADFQQRLSQGDSVTGFNQSPNQSTFTLDDIAPQPAAVTAKSSTAPTGGVDLTITPNTASPNVTSFNVYRATAIATSPATGAPSTCPVNPGGNTLNQSPQVSPTAPYVKVGSVPATTAQNTAGTPYTFTDATTPAPVAGTAPTYCYLVTAVGPNAAGTTQEGTGVAPNTNTTSPTTGIAGVPSAAAVGTLNPKFATNAGAGAATAATVTANTALLLTTFTINAPYVNGPLNAASVDPNGSDYSAVYTDVNGVAHTLTVNAAAVNATVGTSNVVTILATSTDFGAVTPAGGSVIVTAKNGTVDNNTVLNTAATPLAQMVGDALFIKQ